MRDEPRETPGAAKPGAGGTMPGAAILLPFLAALLLFNAHALRRWADNLDYDAPARAPALRVLGPLCRLTAALRLDAPRNCAEALENAAQNW